jgi:hypothetical protein
MADQVDTTVVVDTAAVAAITVADRTAVADTEADATKPAW